MPQRILSANHIAAAAGGYEPQRTNNYTISLTPKGVGADRGVLRLSVRAFPLPKEETGIIEIEYGNEIRKVAGRTTFADLSVTFHDYVDQNVLHQLVQWRRVVYNPNDGTVGLARDYKTNGTVIMFAPNGLLERKWDIKGVWPSKLDPGDLTYENAEKKLITMELVIDRAIEANLQAVPLPNLGGF
jgi:hypothetical protein